ncbi:hypothetical protein TCAL_03466 [Tigriopus californicus]|uniref:Septin n=1 Tax=Tigriopus californicus TaxID=6832 RepID=A0A553NQA1_TIGCA|nr:septin-1-like [Tigriopus californicus]TRY67590.1 hypothetical protein TCAL_03466 [Tigriopus californicus]|eukprot:TCALIF_03466-PA protein Name:"Similar to Sept5 Septin-5 (Rattus norvegicus)" AED:0.07 eAED:0.07 QI:368/1/1/1/1/1/6/159/381
MEQDNFIGFANIADQVHRKSVKRGFEFTLMIVGESGLGKSTLVNSLFLSDLYSDRKIPSVQDRVKRTTEIQKTTMEIEEKGVKLRLTVVDTPGFGDGLEGNGSWKVCVKYVDDQFAAYFDGESGLNRKNIVDTRVHCCLYFIPPYGHGLRQIDLEFLKRLQYKVNLIPVIAKADCLTKSEMKKLKDRINQEIEENDIEIYQFPDCDSDEDEDFKSHDQMLKSSIPFAIIGGTNTLEIGGKRMRGRQMPWGFVEMDNPEHSDFALLRRFLIQTHMQDLKDVTHDVHYENYRVQCLSEMAGLQKAPSTSTSSNSSTSQQLAHIAASHSGGSTERSTHLRKNSALHKSQEELEQETEKLLAEKDEEIKKMHAMIQQMQAKLQSN